MSAFCHGPHLRGGANRLGHATHRRSPTDSFPWGHRSRSKPVASVAYRLWLHRMTGSAAQANRFAPEYGAVHNPARDSGEGPPAIRGGAGGGGRG
ncbi:DUF6417 family protein [Streptomyces sp. NPDC059340]|uniref:DUF6417 family protein n=1 Tax=Streptomyces sp. NPDC059340 TaxID=3346806 RepID=UPI00368C54AC